MLETKWNIRTWNIRSKPTEPFRHVFVIIKIIYPICSSEIQSWMFKSGNESLATWYRQGKGGQYSKIKSGYLTSETEITNNCSGYYQIREHPNIHLGGDWDLRNISIKAGQIIFFKNYNVIPVSFEVQLNPDWHRVKTFKLFLTKFDN